MDTEGDIKECRPRSRSRSKTRLSSSGVGSGLQVPSDRELRIRSLENQFKFDWFNVEDSNLHHVIGKIRRQRR